MAMAKTEYQAEEHRKHPLPTAFEELLHQHLVHRLSFGKLSVRSRNFVHYGFSTTAVSSVAGVVVSWAKALTVPSEKMATATIKKVFHGCLIKILISCIRFSFVVFIY